MDSSSNASSSKKQDCSSSPQQSGIMSSASKLISSLTDNGSSSSNNNGGSASSSASFVKNALSDLVSSEKTRSAGPSSSRQGGGSTWAESSASGSRAAIHYNRPDISTFRTETANDQSSTNIESAYQSFRTSSFSELFPTAPADQSAASIPRSADCTEASLRDGEDVLRLLNDPTVELMDFADVVNASTLLSQDHESTIPDTHPKDTFAEEVTEDPVDWLINSSEGGEYTEMVWGNKPAQRKTNPPEEDEEEEAEEEPAKQEPPKPDLLDLKGNGKAIERGLVLMKSRM